MVTDIFNFFNCVISWVWVFKIQILASVFIGLSIFEYLYKAYLIDKRRKKALAIKMELNRIKKKILTMGTENYNVKDFNELRTEVRIQGAENRAGLELIGATLITLEEKTDNILIETKKTNGRVTVLENETIPDIKTKMNNALGTVIFFRKRKWILALIALGLLWLYDAFTKNDLANKIVNYIF